MAKKVVLTGVKPTGQPHIGNYLGAIRPALRISAGDEYSSFLFIADYHSLTAVHSATELDQMIYEVAATWLACGVDPKKTLIYRQSHLPEVFELAWILSCFCPKGLMNRAHAYKARVAENQEHGREDLDHGVNIGLYTYPVLMAADILLFGTDVVPVGEDQIQHVEIARDLAQKFNTNYKKDLLKLPKASLTESKLVPGLDGRKMSKSYDNSIPLFCESTKLRKLVMRIKTDSSPPEAPKDPAQSLIFSLYKEFANPQEIDSLKEQYLKGISWGAAKEELYKVMDRELTPLRDSFNSWMSKKSEIDDLLMDGAKRGRTIAQELLKQLRLTIGISHL